jgi:putative ABC transport system permease protein
MRILRQDLVFAIRMLAKRPAFTLICIVTLAVSIGANSTIFSLVDGVLLQPLPFPHPERMVDLWTSYPASQGQPDIFSPPNYLDVAARAKSFEAVGSYDNANVTLAGDGEPQTIPGLRMTASMSGVLAISPQLGRWFSAQEDESGRAVLLLSNRFWRSRYAADRGILGRSLSLNGRPYTVLGVLPPATGFPSTTTDVYMPMSFSADDRANRGSVNHNAAARLRAGVSLPSAEAELHTLAAELAREYPAVNKRIQMGAISMRDSLVGNVRGLLVVLWAAVSFMLAVGCANVASLLLAHATGRQREFAVRRSLGAGNGRLIRQLLTESMLLAGIGAAAGLALAMWAIPFMSARLPAGFPHLHEVALNSSVLLFTAAVSLLTGLLFGLAPAMASARRNLAAAIRQGDGRSGYGKGHRRLGRGLVVGEVAVVLVLLVGAGLVLRSLARLSAVEPGFRARGLVVWQLFLPATRYPDAPAQRVFFGNVVRQTAAIPGVESAALVNPLPFGPVDITIDGGFRIAGRPAPAPEQTPQALFTRVTPGYFATMGIPLLRGRDFNARDDQTAPPVAIVSATLARRYFAGLDPVGQRLLLGRQSLAVEIVGVAGDVKHINLRSDVRPELYIPLARFTPGIAGLVVRGRGDAAALLPAVQRRVWSIDSGLAANMAAPVEKLLYASLAPSRIAAVLLALFAAATLVLGLAGIYGVLSYAISQRMREFGIRLALGAAPEDLLRMVLREALLLAIAGVVIGIPMVLVLSRYLDTLLFGVQRLDPATFLIAAAGIPLSALLAALTPALRAMRVEPAASLRAD